MDWSSISGITSAKPIFVSLPFPVNIIFQAWFLIYVSLLCPLTLPRLFFFFLRKRALPVGNEGSTSHWLWFFFSKSFLNNLFLPFKRASDKPSIFPPSL